MVAWRLYIYGHEFVAGMSRDRVLVPMKTCPVCPPVGVVMKRKGCQQRYRLRHFLDRGSKLRGPSPVALVFLYSTLLRNKHVKIFWLEFNAGFVEQLIHYQYL
ncbi:hypothetical protein TNCV_4136451 [Trichonephila clavipes]|nr:hypothetical protein TNCV_4136451 [Trichonephila clavipes]